MISPGRYIEELDPLFSFGAGIFKLHFVSS
jgi:hypothetical protein